MKQRDIYIVSQEGLDARVNDAAVEAIKELMECFPQYKNDYPITDLGAWAASDYMYHKDGKLCLAPYKSTKWHIEMSKIKAREDGRRGQLNAGELMNLMKSDPTNQQIPQFTILLTKDDLYPNKDFNYCLGIGHEGLGCVVSAYRYLGANGKLIDKENFKTVLMHEFGHVIGLTYEGRKNSVEMFGPHCADKYGLCIMQQRADGDYSYITRARLAAKKEGLPPICPDCIEAGNKFFSHERQKSTEKAIVQQAFREFGLRR